MDAADIGFATPPIPAANARAGTTPTELCSDANNAADSGEWQGGRRRRRRRHRSKPPSAEGSPASPQPASHGDESPIPFLSLPASPRPAVGVATGQPSIALSDVESVNNAPLSSPLSQMTTQSVLADRIAALERQLSMLTVAAGGDPWTAAATAQAAASSTEQAPHGSTETRQSSYDSPARHPLAAGSSEDGGPHGGTQHGDDRLHPHTRAHTTFGMSPLLADETPLRGYRQRMRRFVAGADAGRRAGASQGAAGAGPGHTDDPQHRNHHPLAGHVTANAHALYHNQGTRGSGNSAGSGSGSGAGRLAGKGSADSGASSLTHAVAAKGLRRRLGSGGGFGNHGGDGESAAAHVAGKHGRGAGAGSVSHGKPPPAPPKSPAPASDKPPQLEPLQEVVPPEDITFSRFLKTEIGWGKMPMPSATTRSARVFNFIRVPMALERFLAFGFLTCMDAFLHNLTYLPLRFMNALLLAMLQPLFPKSKLFHRTHLYDVLRGLIYICSLIALNHFGQMSRVYHYIRGEAMIKLYVIFNILEILSKLCASVGQDAFDSLYRTTRDTPRSYGSLAGHFLVTLVYVVVHSLFLFVQIVSLNVAINSHSNALLTLLVSNNFIELKGSVFKKFGPENILQISCSDAVERFQLVVYLSLILLQDYRSWESVENFIPTLGYVALSEFGIDWAKHSFLTKFNRLSSDIYGGFKHVLVHDMLSSRRKIEKSLDPTHAVSRRMGFAAIPLTCLVLRLVGLKLESERWSPRWYTLSGGCVYALGFGCLLALKVLLSQVLLVLAQWHGDGGLGNRSKSGLMPSPTLVQWAQISRYTRTQKGIPRD